MAKAKNFIKGLCPPFLYQALGNFRNRNQQSLAIIFSGNYFSYKEAAEKAQGYEGVDIVKYSIDEVAKYELLRQQSPWIDPREQQLITAMGIIRYQMGSENPINVLDFGGGAGRHYLLAEKFFAKHNIKKWTICETEVMTEAATALKFTKNVDFNTDIESLTLSFDIVHTSAAIQYTENPSNIYDVFLKLNPKFIIVNRLPFISGIEDRLTIQKVTRENQVMTMPAWFFSESKWIKKFENNFEIVARWEVPGEQYPLDSQNIMLQGLLLKNKMLT